MRKSYRQRPQLASLQFSHSPPWNKGQPDFAVFLCQSVGLLQCGPVVDPQACPVDRSVGPRLPGSPLGLHSVSHPAPGPAFPSMLPPI